MFFISSLPLSSTFSLPVSFLPSPRFFVCWGLFPDVFHGSLSPVFLITSVFFFHHSYTFLQDFVSVNIFSFNFIFTSWAFSFHYLIFNFICLGLFFYVLNSQFTIATLCYIATLSPLMTIQFCIFFRSCLLHFWKSIFYFL